jgi:hypothetical protein
MKVFRKGNLPGECRLYEFCPDLLVNIETGMFLNYEFFKLLKCEFKEITEPFFFQ